MGSKPQSAVANHLHKSGKKIVLGAGDTFRAAAVEQLTVWAGRIGREIVTESLKRIQPVSPTRQWTSIAMGADVAIIDTAGRLHPKQPEQQLGKIRRVVEKIEQLPTKSCSCLMRQRDRMLSVRLKVSVKLPAAQASYSQTRGSAKGE